METLWNRINNKSNWFLTGNGSGDTEGDWFWNSGCLWMLPVCSGCQISRYSEKSQNPKIVIFPRKRFSQKWCFYYTKITNRKDQNDRTHNILNTRRVQNSQKKNRGKSQEIKIWNWEIWLHSHLKMNLLSNQVEQSIWQCHQMSSVQEILKSKSVLGRPWPQLWCKTKEKNECMKNQKFDMKNRCHFSYIFIFIFVCAFTSTIAN